MDRTTPVATFSTKIEADMAVARLTDAGIKSFVMADNLGGTFPQMQMSTGGFQVHVLSSDKDRARPILANDYPPIESRPGAEVSTLQKTARRVSSPKAVRVRTAFYFTIVFVIIVVLLLNSTS